jgi:hypothetical protein
MSGSILIALNGFALDVQVAVEKADAVDVRDCLRFMRLMVKGCLSLPMPRKLAAPVLQDSFGRQKSGPSAPQIICQNSRQNCKRID